MIKFNGSEHKAPLKTNFKSTDQKQQAQQRKVSFIQKLIDEAELKITDVGSFSVIVEKKNTNPAKYISSYGVMIKPENSDAKAARVMKFFAKNESKTSTHESDIKYTGTRDEIIEYLKSGEVMRELENYTDFISQKFYLENKR